jgi:hypothetical protein
MMEKNRIMMKVDDPLHPLVLHCPSACDLKIIETQHGRAILSQAHFPLGHELVVFDVSPSARLSLLLLGDDPELKDLAVLHLELEPVNFLFLFLCLIGDGERKRRNWTRVTLGKRARRRKRGMRRRCWRSRRVEQGNAEKADGLAHPEDARGRGEDGFDAGVSEMSRDAKGVENKTRSRDEQGV